MKFNFAFIHFIFSNYLNYLAIAKKKGNNNQN